MGFRVERLALGHVSLCFAFLLMWLRIETISGVTVIDFYAP